jgi:predicted DNA-binding protein
MGRTRSASKSIVISIRLPEEVIERLDSYVDELRSVTPGINITRTDAARSILIKHLPEPTKTQNLRKRS